MDSYNSGTVPGLELRLSLYPLGHHPGSDFKLLVKALSPDFAPTIYWTAVKVPAQCKPHEMNSFAL